MQSAFVSPHTIFSPLIGCLMQHTTIASLTGSISDIVWSSKHSWYVGYASCPPSSPQPTMVASIMASSDAASFMRWTVHREECDSSDLSDLGKKTADRVDGRRSRLSW